VTTEDDDELKQFGLDGAERVERPVDGAPTPGFVTGFSLMSAQEKGVLTHEEIAKFDSLRAIDSIDSIDLSPDSIAKLGDTYNSDLDLGRTPRTETARQMAKCMHFGLAAGMSAKKASEFLTAEEYERLLVHSPVKNALTATWSTFGGHSKKKL
jgi:hypothetical protein